MHNTVSSSAGVIKFILIYTKQIQYISNNLIFLAGCSLLRLLLLSFHLLITIIITIGINATTVILNIITMNTAINITINVIIN